jgi:hypothetical protein
VGGGYCLLVTVNSYSQSPRLTIEVHCYSAARVPGDTTFAAAYLRAP